MLDLLDPTHVVYFVGLIIPLLVGFVTKKLADGAVKGWLNAALSALAVVIAILAGPDGSWEWQAFLKAFLETFVVSIAAYYGLYKPTGVAAAVQNLAPNFGVGKVVQASPDDYEVLAVHGDPTATYKPVDFTNVVDADPDVEVSPNQTPISDYVPDEGDR